MEVSVVVPTHDRAILLPRLLRSLDGLERRVPAEVILVNDGSRDATPAILRGWERSPHPFHPRVLSLDRPAGPGAARNLGFEQATGETIAFTDDDCRVHPRWLESLVAALDPARGVVGVGGKVEPENRDLTSRFYTFHGVLQPPQSMAYLVSANCCYDRRSLLQVGGFEGDIRTPGGEDVGLSFKLRRKGYRFAYSATAVVYHEFRQGVRDVFRTFRNYGRGCRLVTERYAANGGGQA